MEFCITSLDRIILNPGINYTIGVAQLDCLLGFLRNHFIRFLGWMKKTPALIHRNALGHG